MKPSTNQYQLLHDLKTGGFSSMFYLAFIFSLLVSIFFGFPSETILAKSLYAPVTPSGSSLKNDSPV